MLTVWAWTLLSSVAIGTFVLSVLLTGQKSKRQATYLFSALLFVLVASNADNWLYASGLWLKAPLLVGFSRASILLIGPLIYLYSKSITSLTFRLSWVHLLHTIPYLAAYAMLVPWLYLKGADYKIAYVNYGFEGAIRRDLMSSLFLAVYSVHLLVYLVLTLRLMRAEMKSDTKVNLVVPTIERARWIRKLAAVFGLCLALLVVLSAWVLITRSYHAGINFAITSSYSLLLYYLGACIVRNENLINPGFARKYQSVNVSDAQRREYAARLKALVEKEHIHFNPNMTIGNVAEHIGIPSGYLSKLINEEHGKSFPDFINHHRVEEVKRRLVDPNYAHLSIVGLATEVGFSSKSSFNAAFKKYTGMTPSDYKRSTNRPS